MVQALTCSLAHVLSVQLVGSCYEKRLYCIAIVYDLETSSEYLSCLKQCGRTEFLTTEGIQLKFTVKFRLFMVMIVLMKMLCVIRAKMYLFSHQDNKLERANWYS